MGLLFNIARTPSKMLLKILVLLILQGAWVSYSRIIPEVKEGVIPNNRPTGFGGSEDFGMSRITDGKPRVKRCTCYSYMDRECVYYCHLDIIWVNTPERTVPYGMSSYQAPQRIRRETFESPRCLCVVADADRQCRDFCQSRLGWQSHPTVSTEAQGEVDSLKPSESLGHGSLQSTLSLLASPLLNLAPSLQVLAHSREEPWSLTLPAFLSIIISGASSFKLFSIDPLLGKFDADLR